MEKSEGGEKIKRRGEQRISRKTEGGKETSFGVDPTLFYYTCADGHYQQKFLEKSLIKTKVVK